MTDPVVQVEGLHRQFRQKVALDDVTLDIPSGCVYGLVGENGAGKTTLLKHILGLYKPQQGTVKVFGMSPVEQSVEVLGQVGYLSEDRSLPTWMSIAELLNYTAAFYPTWDTSYAKELLETFELNERQKVNTLSRGQKARVGLLLALSYRPTLLVLDEPSSGLDAIVRRDILAAIIRTVADDGRTVVFSSHLLDEVQRVSDRFAMLHHGKLLISGDLNETLAAHERLTFRFREPLAELPIATTTLQKDDVGKEWSVLCNGDREVVTKSLVEAGAEIVERRAATLDDLFVAKAKGVRPAKDRTEDRIKTEPTK